MNAKHSSKTDMWFTPPEFLDAARAALGSIELDPASCEEANKNVRAKRIITKEENGLEARWNLGSYPISVFCNPPGGKLGNKSLTALFWNRLTTEYYLGNVRSAIFLAFNIEALQTTQSCRYPMAAFPLCIPNRRISFINAEGTPQKGNTHASVFALLPDRELWTSNTTRFENAFSGFGAVLNL